MVYINNNNNNNNNMDIDMDKNNMTICITGGAGYLGSLITAKLLQIGYNVRVLDKLFYGDTGIITFANNPNFELIRGDLTDIHILQRVIKDAYAVIHLAALVGDPVCYLMPDVTIAINYLSTELLARCCKYYGVKRFVFASTCSVYGAGDDIFTEESMLNPVSLYAESKIQAEKSLLELADENFCPTILRKGTIFGLSPRMRFDLVVNLLAAKAIVEKQIPIYGGNQWRPFLHVSDAADAYIKCIEAPLDIVNRQIFNVGDNTQNFQLADVGKCVKKYVPNAQLLVHDSDIDMRNYRVDFSKIKNILGYSAKLTISDGIHEIIEAFKQHKISDYRDKKYHNYLSDHKEYYENILMYDSKDKF